MTVRKRLIPENTVNAVLEAVISARSVGSTDRLNVDHYIRPDRRVRKDGGWMPSFDMKKAFKLPGVGRHSLDVIMSGGTFFLLKGSRSSVRMITFGNRGTIKP